VSAADSALAARERTVSRSTDQGADRARCVLNVRVRPRRSAAGGGGVAPHAHRDTVGGTTMLRQGSRIGDYEVTGFIAQVRWARSIGPTTHGSVAT
jgi:hypothetical protein